MGIFQQQIFVDGRPVEFILDSSCTFSSCPTDWHATSPSHVQSIYADSFSFLALLSLHSSTSLSSLVLGHNWINAEYSAHRGVFSIHCIVFIHNTVSLPTPGSSSSVAGNPLLPSMPMLC